MKIKRNINLSVFTTLRIGGPAKYYCEVANDNELVESVKFAKENKLKTFVIGEGSDILVSDDGFKGLVIKILNNSLEFNKKTATTFVTAGSGMIWDNLVEKCVEKKLQGIECMSGIPGTVGAAPIQNIGAYGQEIKDVFVSLKAYDTKEEKFVELGKQELGFAYRESMFKKKENWQRFVIIKVTLELNTNGKPEVKYDSLKKYLEINNIKNPTLLDVRNSVLEVRKSKFENYKKVPNAGSFFKNPVINSLKLNDLKKNHDALPCFDNGDGTYKCFAGWFIEQAGWKGKNLGNAQVSPKHALVLLNPNRKANAKEIKELAEKITEDVDKKFGIKLETEVQYVD